MRKGFTLLELLIVVIIIGILATVAVPQFFKAASKAKEGKALADLDVIKKYQQAYFSKHGTWDTWAANAEFTASVDLDDDGDFDVRIDISDKYYQYNVVVSGDCLATTTILGLRPMTMDLNSGKVVYGTQN